MAKNTKYLLLGFVFSVVVMLSIPPWAHHGYEPIFSASEHHNLDWSRLLLQIFIALTIFIGLLIALPGNRQTSKTETVRPMRIFVISIVLLSIAVFSWSAIQSLNREEVQHTRNESSQAQIAERLAMSNNQAKIEAGQRQRLQEEAEQANTITRRHLEELSKARRWPDIANICPGISAYLQTSWQNGQIYFRISLVGKVDALEYANARSHRYTLELLDSANQSIYIEAFDSRDFVKFKDQSGKVYSVGTEQLCRPLAGIDYERITSWRLRLSKNRVEV